MGLGRRSGWLGGSILALALCGCATKPLPQAPAAALPPPPPDLNALYDKAIFDSAVKRPEFEVDLTSIDKAKATVTVVSFHREAASPFDEHSHKLRRSTWVALPEELQAKCRGRGDDAVLALEEILGLPPQNGQAESWRISTFTVPTHRIFRPCASSPDVSAPRCTLAIAKANGSQEDFVYRQMWSSYQEGPSIHGYPFTGMGWTYDWGPDAKSHVGVSEYVVREGTGAADVHTMSPAEFCAGAAVSEAATSAPPPAAAEAPKAQ